MSQRSHVQHIQVDTSDDDSLFDSQSLVASNLSIASSVQDYCYENGRRYHAYRHGQYPFPNDEEEQDRLTLMHHLFKLLTGGELYCAPITLDSNSPQRVLDIGTGTGEWAVDIAESFPNAEIIGTDLSPIQPAWAPSNCRFFVDDAESDWAFTQDDAFDYIHARSMSGGIGNWRRLLQQAYAHLKPGGWFEAQEFEAWVYSDDGGLQRATTVLDWQRRLNQASEQFGKPMTIAPVLAQWMQEGGFVNVVDDVYKCPIGGWAKDSHLKEIGRICKASSLKVVEPYSLALLTRVLGFSYQDAQEYMDKVRAEMMNSSFHFYTVFHYVYGQRPMEDSATNSRIGAP